MTIPSGPPLIWSAVALGLALLGCIAAIRGWLANGKERSSIRRAKTALTADEAWEGAFTTDEVELSKWLRTRGISLDSCIADSIRACWSAWLGGRATSLTELHVLVARRERARGSARLSAGIAGLLLVVGIVGTLSSVHPILKAFQFQVSSSGELQEVAQSTALVNSLVNNLGDAFWPSIIALGGTVFVVSFRGCYALSLHQFTLQLDRFAISSLIPRYRPSSIAQEYSDVKRILSELSDDISRREQGFGSVVQELQKLVTGITPAIEALKATAEQSDEAAKKLSARSNSIADGITRNLGPNSPIYLAVSGFEGIFERTTKALDSLTSEVSSIGQENRKDREHLVGVVEKLTTKVDLIGTDHAKHKEEVEGLLGQLRTGISNAPKTITDAANGAVTQGLQLLQSSVDKFRNESKEEGDLIIEEVRKQTSEKLDELTAASAEIPKAAQELKALITTKSEVETAAVAAIRKQQAESEAALAKPIEDLKNSASDLETSRKSLMDAVESATSALEETKKSVQNLPSRSGGGGGIGRGARDHEPSQGSVPVTWGQSGRDGSADSGEAGDLPEPEPTIRIDTKSEVPGTWGQSGRDGSADSGEAGDRPKPEPTIRIDAKSEGKKPKEKTGWRSKLPWNK
jgi:hypothetical protein